MEPYVLAMTEVSTRSKRDTDEFKSEAVEQVLERRYSVVDVALRLGINKHSLYDWLKRPKRAQVVIPTEELPTRDSPELRRLRAELRRPTEERDILKKAAAHFAEG